MAIARDHLRGHGLGPQTERAERLALDLRG